MKTPRLSTILTSTYLSAVLALSVAPIRSDAADQARKWKVRRRDDLQQQLTKCPA